MPKRRFRRGNRRRPRNRGNYLSNRVSRLRMVQNYPYARRGAVQYLPNHFRSAYNYPTYIGSFGNFLPKTKVMKLKYACEYQLNASATVMSAAIFRANSPYDFESAIGGHSAYGLDEIMRFYLKYRTLSSKIKVWSVAPAVVDSIPSYVTIVKSGDGQMFQSFADTTHLLECNVRSPIKICGQFMVANQMAQAQPITLTSTYSQKNTSLELQI